MKVLALCGSPRKGGNSEILLDEVLRGAGEAGWQVEKVHLQDLGLSPCRACYACRGKGVCIQKDGADELLEKMVDSDAIVLASPVYFYSVSAQMKILIDRTLPRYTELIDKKLIFILTAADEEARMRRAAESLYGFADCLPGSQVVSVIYGEGVYQKGEVRGTAAMARAYEAGRSL